MTKFQAEVKLDLCYTNGMIDSEKFNKAMNRLNEIEMIKSMHWTTKQNRYAAVVAIASN